MFNFLEAFEKRMEMVGIVESIINRKSRNMELERLFNDNEFINLVFSTLLYIMEKTLAEDSDCDSENILKFIEAILPEYYNLQLSKNQLSQLTNYIIKNVLQNEGAPYYFQSIDYADKSKKAIIIRLITDHEKEGNTSLTYTLTDQGYEFLFRTKEVDQEIKMTIEELKLKELIKRKNFKGAYNQSLNLIQMIRQKKKEIQIFMTKIKQNIHDVDIDEFEKLISSTYDLLNDEYDELNNIMELSHKSEEKIRQEYEISLKLDESLKKAQTQIKQINYNIKATLSEQKDLILGRQSLSKVYIDTIGDSFVYSMENRFNIEDVILKQMEQHVEKVEMFWQLVNPLFMPNVNKNLNIRSIYEPQGMIKLEDEDKIDYIEDESYSKDVEKERIERINEIYIEILDYVLKQALKALDDNKICTLQDIINLLKADAVNNVAMDYSTDTSLFQKFTEDRILFTTLLKLYDIGTIDVATWRSSGTRVVMNLTEELNLEYCLSQLKDNYDYVNRIKKFEVLKNEDDLFEIELKRDTGDGYSIIEKIEISNFIIRMEIENE